jgi:uncharacterized membrane-anchored protein
MGDPRTQKGGLWVVIGVLCCVGGFLLWMFIQKIAGCTPGFVNLIWPLLIVSFGPTPSGRSASPGRSEALRRP